MTHWNMSDYDERFSVRDKNSHSIHVNKMSYAHSKISREIFTLVNYNCNLSVISSEQMIFIIEWICWLFRHLYCVHPSLKAYHLSSDQASDFAFSNNNNLQERYMAC